MPRYLKTVRKGRRLTQQKLADKIGLSQTQISCLERGTTRGSVDAWDRLEIALNVPAKELRADVKEEE